MQSSAKFAVTHIENKSIEVVHIEEYILSCVCPQAFKPTIFFLALPHMRLQHWGQESLKIVGLWCKTESPIIDAIVVVVVSPIQPLTDDDQLLNCIRDCKLFSPGGIVSAERGKANKMKLVINVIEHSSTRRVPSKLTLYKYPDYRKRPVSIPWQCNLHQEGGHVPPPQMRQHCDLPD